LKPIKKVQVPPLSIRFEELDESAVLTGVVVSQHTSAKYPYYPYYFIDCGIYRICSSKYLKEVEDAEEINEFSMKGKVKRVQGRLVVPSRQKLKLGEVIETRVRNIKRSNALLELGFHRSKLLKRSSSRRMKFQHDLEELKAGDAVNGRIVQLYKGGALIDVGAFRRTKNARGEVVQKPVAAWLMRDHFAENVGSEADPVRSSSIQSVLKLNDELIDCLRVWQALPASGRLRVTMREVDNEQDVIESKQKWIRERNARLRKRPIASFNIGDEVEGVIAPNGIYSYGVQVNIGARNPALLHVNQMPQWMWGETWKQELNEDEKLYLKVFEVDSKRGRIQVELIGSQKQLETQLLELVQTDSARLRRNTSKRMVNMSTTIEQLVIKNMNDEMRSNLLELRNSSEFAATARYLPTENTTVPNIAKSDGQVEPKDEEESEDEVDDEEDPFDDDYFEDKYG